MSSHVLNLAGNAVKEFKGSTSTNPWDVVLMMEGCVLIAGTWTKRLSQPTPADCLGVAIGDQRYVVEAQKEVT